MSLLCVLLPALLIGSTAQALALPVTTETTLSSNPVPTASTTISATMAATTASAASRDSSATLGLASSLTSPHDPESKRLYNGDHRHSQEDLDATESSIILKRKTPNPHIASKRVYNGDHMHSQEDLDATESSNIFKRKKPDPHYTEPHSDSGPAPPGSQGNPRPRPTPIAGVDKRLHNANSGPPVNAAQVDALLHAGHRARRWLRWDPKTLPQVGPQRRDVTTSQGGLPEGDSTATDVSTDKKRRQVGNGDAADQYLPVVARESIPMAQAGEGTHRPHPGNHPPRARRGSPKAA